MSTSSVAALRGVEIGVGLDLSERTGETDVPRWPVEEAGEPFRCKLPGVDGCTGESFSLVSTRFGGLEKLVSIAPEMVRPRCI